MEQAMLLGLRSMQNVPEKHAAAIAVVERELAMIRELDRTYIEATRSECIEPLRGAT